MTAPELNDHELWHVACEFVEAEFGAKLAPRLWLRLVDSMVRTGIAREMLADGRLVAA